MANPEHLAKLKEGVEAWNKWREENPGVMPDFIGANLSKITLRGANLFEADFRGTDLSGAILIGVDLRGADLTRAELTEARLNGANLSRANLSGANLSNVYFNDTKGKSPAILTEANLSEVKISDVSSDLFFDLSSTKGIETAKFENEHILSDYIEEAFRQASIKAHKARESWPLLVDMALDRINAIRSLYKDQKYPDQLVEVVKLITSELIAYLKKHPREMYNIRPRQFEELIAEILVSYGWEVTLRPETRDGGYDVYAISKDDSGVESHWIIECKKYAKVRKVGIDIARNLYAVKSLYGVAGAMLATTSDFTKGVHDFKASRYDFDLRNYASILEWINEYKPNPNGKLYIKDNKLIVPGEE